MRQADGMGKWFLAVTLAAVLLMAGCSVVDAGSSAGASTNSAVSSTAVSPSAAASSVTGSLASAASSVTPSSVNSSSAALSSGVSVAASSAANSSTAVSSALSSITGPTAGSRRLVLQTANYQGQRSPSRNLGPKYDGSVSTMTAVKTGRFTPPHQFVSLAPLKSPQRSRAVGRSAMYRAPSNPFEGSIDGLVAVDADGNVIWGELVGGEALIDLPTNSSYVLYLMIATNGDTNYVPFNYPSGTANQLVMDPGAGDDMSDIDLGTVQVDYSGEAVPSNDPNGLVDSDQDGAVNNTDADIDGDGIQNDADNDDDGDGAIDNFGDIDANQDGYPDTVELYLGEGSTNGLDSWETNYEVSAIPDAIYVSQDGSDDNDGSTPATALLTIQWGVEYAKWWGVSTVKVEAGLYTNNAGLQDAAYYYEGVAIDQAGLKLEGGYDSGFTAQTGTSILDATGCVSPYRVITVNGADNAEISCFTLIGGLVTNSEFGYPYNTGGAIIVVESRDVKISNVVVSNNVSSYGGGLYAYAAEGLNLDISAVSNASGSGGGIYLESTMNAVVAGEMSNNSAVDGGGGIMVYGGVNVTVSGAVRGNSVDTSGGGYGGGLAFYETRNSAVTGAVANNASVYGAGIYMGNGSENRLTGDVFQNQATGSGGGLYVEASANNTIAGNINGNTADVSGGGAMLTGADNNKVSGHIEQNHVPDSASDVGGGGLMVQDSTGTIIDGAVMKDNTSIDGASVFVEDSPQTSFLDTVIDYANEANDQYESVMELKDDLEESYDNLLELKDLVMSNMTIFGGGISNLIRENPVSLPISNMTIKNMEVVGTNSAVYKNRDGEVATNMDELSNVVATTNVPSSTNIATNTSPGDTNGPTVAISLPANGDSNTNTTITISGTASDDQSGVKRVDIAVDNFSYSPANGTDSWSKELNLSVGTHTLKAIAVDKAGNSSAIQEITYIVTAPPQPLQRPTINVNTWGINVFDVKDGQATNLTFTGVATCANDHVLSAIKCSVDSNAFNPVITFRQPVSNTNWSVTMQFSAGKHTVYFFSEDNYAGNTSSTNTLFQFEVRANANPTASIACPEWNWSADPIMVASRPISGQPCWIRIEDGNGGKIQLPVPNPAAGVTYSAGSQWEAKATIQNSSYFYTKDPGTNVSVTLTKYDETAKRVSGSFSGLLYKYIGSYSYSAITISGSFDNLPLY